MVVVNLCQSVAQGRVLLVCELIIAAAGLLKVGYHNETDGSINTEWNQDGWLVGSG